MSLAMGVREYVVPGHNDQQFFSRSMTPHPPSKKVIIVCKVRKILWVVFYYVFQGFERQKGVNKSKFVLFLISWTRLD